MVLSEEQVIRSVEHWLTRFVVDLKLCPFAEREVERNSIRYVVVDTPDTASLPACLADELVLLGARAEVETTLVILSRALPDFLDFNEFLGDCDQLLRDLDLEGVYQIASFHPHYQFAGTAPDDAENFSNRSPYPILHILREASVERAIAGHPDINAVPLRNIETLRQMGTKRLAELWRSCIDE